MWICLVSQPAPLVIMRMIFRIQTIAADSVTKTILLSHLTGLAPLVVDRTQINVSLAMVPGILILQQGNVWILVQLDMLQFLPPLISVSNAINTILLSHLTGLASLVMVQTQINV